MYRVMSNIRLMILIKNNTYLINILKNCETAKELEHRIESSACMKSTCLINVNWSEVYKNLKEV